MSGAFSRGCRYSIGDRVHWKYYDQKEIWSSGDWFSRYYSIVVMSQVGHILQEDIKKRWGLCQKCHAADVILEEIMFSTWRF